MSRAASSFSIRVTALQVQVATNQRTTLFTEAYTSHTKSLSGPGCAVALPLARSADPTYTHTGTYIHVV
jgi:hypothetical protein